MWGIRAVLPSNRAGACLNVCVMTHSNESCHTYEWVMAHKWRAGIRTVLQFKWRRCLPVCVWHDSFIRAPRLICVNLHLSPFRGKSWLTGASLYSKLPVNLPLLYQGVWGRADATSDTTNLSNAFQIENSATIGCAVSICKTSHGKIMNESCHTHETQSKSTFLNQCPPTRQVRSYRLQCVFSNTLCSMHTTTRTLQHAHAHEHCNLWVPTWSSQLPVSL